MWTRARRPMLVFALASIGYVALVSVRRATDVGLAGAGFCALAMVLAWVAAHVKARPLSWASWGAGIVVASIVDSSPGVRVAAVGGAIAAAAAGVFALARMPSLGGIVRDRKRSPKMGVALLAAVWVPALVAIGGGLVESRGAFLDLTAWLVVSGSAVTTLALLGLAAAARLERRLELGVVERLDAFLLVSAAVVVVTIAGSVVGWLAAAPAASVACAFVGLVACGVAELGDPIALWRGARRGTAIAGLAGALAGLFGFLVVDQRAHERDLVAALALVALVVGAELPRIAQSVRGGASRRLVAAANASRALRARDADQSLAAALRALQTSLRHAELWTLDPVRILRVDAAGYAHEDPGEVPPELIVIACGEPESTLRAEALAAVEVRRADLRPLSQWMSDAKMASATLIASSGEIEGILFLPAYEGAPDLSLEEARALRELADQLAPLCHARAKILRSMTREQTARTEADEAITRAERLEHLLVRASAHHALAAARLARPAAVGFYAARSRTVYESLERLTKSQAPIAIVARSGVDPVPFLARAHLAGARRAAPLVLVDGTSTREHDLDRWRDPVASPLALADGGVLVLLDAAALPIDVQRLVGQSLAERRAPWERPDALDIVVAITTTSAPRDLADTGRLDALLASRLGPNLDDPITLPGIADRPEDIRALVTDRLAREGLRVHGAPVGIEDSAFAILVNHPFEGEDAELASIVQRLVARTRGDVVREADVRGVLAAELVPAAPAVISPKPSRRGT